MKKFIFAAALFFVNVGMVNAANFTTNVLVSAEDIKEGETVDVTLELEKIDENGLASAQYVIHTQDVVYECNNMSYDQGEEGEFSCSYSDNLLRILYVDSDLGKSPIKNGSFITLKATALKDTNSDVIVTNLETDGYSQVINDEVVIMSTDVVYPNMSSADNPEDTEGEGIENPNTGIFVGIASVFMLIIVLIICNKKFNLYRRFVRL